MATQQQESMAMPSADVVGKHFVTNYYHDLMNMPHIALRYYTSESRLMRVEAGPMGNVVIAKTLNEIEGVVISIGHENCTPEILTVDTLDSNNQSIFVLVTGTMHKGDTTKKFVQSFFLFPGSGRHFVFYDIFRYLGEESQRYASAVDNDSDGTYESSQTASVDNDSDGIYESLQTASSTGAVPEASGFAPSAMGEEASGIAEKPEISVHFKESVDSEQLGTEVAMYHQMTDAFSPENLRPVEQLSSQHDVLSAPLKEGPAGKLSYAAILKLQSNIDTSSQTAVSSHQPVSNPKQSSSQHNRESQLPRAQAHAPTKAKQELIPVEKRVDLRSVFVKNLPASITNRQLEDEISRFGPLQPNRVSLKTTESGLTYAFVDFEDVSSAQAAIEASPILFGGRKIGIEKRTSVYRGGRRLGRLRGPR